MMLHYYLTIFSSSDSIPVCCRPFPLFLNEERGSTGSKQTSKGLFIFYLFNQRSFLDYCIMGSDWEMVFINTYALISTSTPDGKSNLLRASTVLEEEV